MELMFVPCRQSGKTVKFINPFTKEPVTLDAPKPLSSAEWKAIRNLLTDETGNLVYMDWLELADGGLLKISHVGPDPGKELVNAEVGKTGLTPDVLQRLSDLLHAADWLCCSPDGFGTKECIVPSASLVKDASKHFEKPVACESLDELAAFLAPRHKKWLDRNERKVKQWIAKNGKKFGK